MAKILIKDFIVGDMAVSYEDGERCLQNILSEIEKMGSDEKIILDFSGVGYVITAFLNPIIGDLIIEKGMDIMKLISIENADENILKKIKLVKEGALLKREDLKT